MEAKLPSWVENALPWYPESSRKIPGPYKGRWCADSKGGKPFGL